jgi:hypothetical protein
MYSASPHFHTHQLQVDNECVSNAENRYNVDYFNDDMEMTCVTCQQPVSGFPKAYFNDDMELTCGTNQQEGSACYNSKENDQSIVERANNTGPIHSLKTNIKALETKLSDSQLEFTCMVDVTNNGVEEVLPLQSERRPCRPVENTMLQNEERQCNAGPLGDLIHDSHRSSPPEFLELQQQLYICEPEIGETSMSLEYIGDSSSFIPNEKPDRSPEREESAMSLKNFGDVSSHFPHEMLAKKQTVSSLMDVKNVSLTNSHRKQVKEYTSMSLEATSHVSTVTLTGNPEIEQTAIDVMDITQILLASPEKCKKATADQTAITYKGSTPISTASPDRESTADQTAITLKDNSHISHISPAMPNKTSVVDQATVSLGDISHTSPVAQDKISEMDQPVTYLEDVRHTAPATPDTIISGYFVVIVWYS